MASFYETEILYETEISEELTNVGLYYSDKFNVIESKEWANLKEEAGATNGGKLSEETKDKIKNSLIGQKRGVNDFHSEIMIKMWKNLSNEEKEKRLEKFVFKKHTKESKKKLSISLKEYHKHNDNSFKGKTHSEETKQKMKNSHWSKTGGAPWNKGKNGLQKVSEKCKIAAGKNAKKLFEETRWLNKDGIRKRVKIDELNHYIENEWVLGWKL